MGVCPFCRVSPIGKSARAVTCGQPDCVAANSRYHKAQWWRKHRGKAHPAAHVNLEGAVPEMDFSGNALRVNIPEVDTSDMPDTRKSRRVKM